jgi:hypothetical protein
MAKRVVKRGRHRKAEPEKRTIEKKFVVNDDEQTLIKAEMRRLGITNFSVYVRMKLFGDKESHKTAA